MSGAHAYAKVRSCQQLRVVHRCFVKTFPVEAGMVSTAAHTLSVKTDTQQAAILPLEGQKGATAAAAAAAKAAMGKGESGTDQLMDSI